MKKNMNKIKQTNKKKKKILRGKKNRQEKKRKNWKGKNNDEQWEQSTRFFNQLLSKYRIIIYILQQSSLLNTFTVLIQ